MTKGTGIITGAAGGIGQATAQRFASSGWSLVLVDVTPKVEDVAKDVAKATGQRVVGVTADITTEAGVAQIEPAVKALGQPLTFLGLVAGVLQEVGSIETLAMSEWDRVMSINLRANVLMIKHFTPALKAAAVASGGASIVTVSSWYGKSGHGLFSAYCASKAGLISLTHSAAAELADFNVRVNTVAPGNVGTSMHFNALHEEAAKRGMTFQQMKDIEWGKIPLKRAAEPSEIAAAIHFLASADGAYLTGATIDVNGGCLFS